MRITAFRVAVVLSLLAATTLFTGARQSASASPQGAPPGIRMVLERTIKPEDGTPGMFAQPMHIVVDARGNSYVFDTKPPSIKMFDAQGKFVRTIGREGSGPGEYRGRVLLFLVADTLIVQDMQNGRAVLIRTDGTPARVWPTACCYNLRAAADDSGRIPISMQLGKTPSLDYMVGMGYLRYRTDGTIADTIHTLAKPDFKVWPIKSAGGQAFGMPIPMVATRQFAFDRAGRLVYGDEDRATLVVSRTGRDTVRTIALAGLPPGKPVADSSRRAMFAGMQSTSATNRWVFEGKIDDIPKIAPRWQTLAFDGAGRIWVSLDDGFLAFDANGTALGRVPLAPLENQYTTYWTRDHYYEIGENKDGEVVMRVFRIERT